MIKDEEIIERKAAIVEHSLEVLKQFNYDTSLIKISDVDSVDKIHVDCDDYKLGSLFKNVIATTNKRIINLTDEDLDYEVTSGCQSFMTH